jgi:hypothetical protein
MRIVDAIRLHSKPVNERNRDLDEAAGAADATACSRDGYFLSYKICVLSDNRLRCAVPTFLDDALEAQEIKETGNEEG